MKMIKYISSFKAIVVLSLICGFALTATAQDYYPTDIGNTWVFLSADGTEKRTYSIEAPEADEGEGIIILRIFTETIGTDTVDNDVYYISDDAGDLKLHRTRLEEGAFGIAAAMLDPPALFFPADLPLGKKWDIVTVTELDLVGTATTTSTIEVVAIEDVETPIGTIENCVKLEISRRVVTALAVLRTTSFQWLGADIGPVKFQDDQDIVYELHSYDLVQATAEQPETPETPAESDTSEEVTVPTEPDTSAPTEPDTSVPTESDTSEEVTVPTEPDTSVPTEPDTSVPTESDTSGEVTVPEPPTEPTETPEEPETPVVPETPSETPEEPKSTFNVSLVSGLNLISIPLMPEEPYTAKSLAEKLSATIVIKLDAEKQAFVGYSSAEEGDGFDINGSNGYIVNTPERGMATFTGTAWTMQSEKAAAAPKVSTTNSTWAFVITSNLQGKVADASYTMLAKNLRTCIITSQKVATDKGYVSAVWADLNRKSVIRVNDEIEFTLVDEKGTIVSGPFQRTITSADIHNAYLSVEMHVGDVRLKETILAQNFPNPFNPETWIPFQLSRAAIVTIKIYDVSGHTVRTLNLGHKSIGSYMTTSTAAYWDGKNNTGESVSSGIYFYSLQTKDFSATRRMVILK